MSSNPQSCEMSPLNMLLVVQNRIIWRFAQETGPSISQITRTSCYFTGYWQLHEHWVQCLKLPFHQPRWNNITKDNDKTISLLSPSLEMSCSGQDWILHSVYLTFLATSTTVSQWKLNILLRSLSTWLRSPYWMPWLSISWSASWFQTKAYLASMKFHWLYKQLFITSLHCLGTKSQLFSL